MIVTVMEIQDLRIADRRLENFNVVTMHVDA